MKFLTQTSVTGTSKRLLLVTVCLAVLLAQVDTFVVNLAMRSIVAGLHASASKMQWVLDAWVGAAFLLPASLAIIRVEWHAEQACNHALGIWAACNGLAFVIGPTVGGGLVDGFGWRSVFLIAVPLGAAAIALALCVVPESHDPAGRRFDAMGQIWGAATLACLALAGIEAGHDRIVAVTALPSAGVALLVFLSTERRRRDGAMMPLDIFSRRLAGTLAATAAMTFGIYGMLFLIPLVWQATGAFHARGAGIALVPMAAVYFVVSNASGRVVDRFGARTLISGGTGLIGAGLLLLRVHRCGSLKPDWCWPASAWA